jgi:hypothetical protein
MRGMGKSPQNGVRTKGVSFTITVGPCTLNTRILRGIDSELPSPLHTGGGPLSYEENVEEERWNQRGKILVCGILHSYHVWRYPITSQVEVERRGEPVLFIAMEEY